jgi:hypothetical protein
MNRKVEYITLWKNVITLGMYDAHNNSGERKKKAYGKFPLNQDSKEIKIFNREISHFLRYAIAFSR